MLAVRAAKRCSLLAEKRVFLPVAEKRVFLPVAEKHVFWRQSTFLVVKHVRWR